MHLIDKITWKRNGGCNLIVVHMGDQTETYDIAAMSQSERGHVMQMVKNWWASRHNYAPKKAA